VSGGGRAGSSRQGARSRRTASSSRSNADRRADRRGPARLLPSALTRGQRPFVLAFIALLVALATMGATPAQRYLETQDRVEALTQRRDELAHAVEGLEERKARLQDPDRVELIARRELGLVEPGEIPYVVVRPDDDPPRLEGRAPQPAAVDHRPWWRRLGEAVGLLSDDHAGRGR
jgi:cell division protein FtsB